MATPNVVPRADQEGGLGTSAKSWGKIFIENPTDGGTAAATISNLDVDQIALDINANNTTANIIDVSTSALTTGSALNFDVTDTVTGTATANIIEIDYDKSGVVTASNIRTVRGIDINLADSATNNGSGFVQLVGQKITLNNTNATGTIIHTGLDISATGGDASQTHGIIITTEDGGTDLAIRSSADSGDKFTIATTAAGATTISTIDDDNHAADLTFSIDGFVKFDSAGTDGGGVEIENGSASGNAALLIDNDDVDQKALDIHAANTTANIININAQTLTTGSAIYIDANKYENGSGIIHVDFDDDQTTTLNRGNNGLINADYDKSVATASSQTTNVIGISSNMLDSATNVGTHTMTAFYGLVRFENTGGTVEGIGMELSVTDADTNTGIMLQVEDGGDDIKMRSSANAGDYATIAVGAEGATTITTVDADTTAAHFEVAADGNIILDAAGTITFEQASNSASMPASDGKVVVQTTTLKVMPDRFFANGDSGRSIFVADNQTNKLGIHQYNTADELYAHIEIPFGHTVTEVHVYCSDTITNGVTVGAYNYQTGADNNVTTTTGNTNADIALSSNTIAGGATQDLWIKVELGASDKYLWGAKVTLAVT